MPYIDQQVRGHLDSGEFVPERAGELNYVLTRTVEDYLTRQGGISYSNLNEVLGVLTAVQLELYRRLAAPYEDEKRDQNGEVYELVPTTQERRDA